MNATSPSWRIDELSRRVLIAAKWPATALVSTQFIPTPHLDELERSLEIHLSPHANDGSTDQSATTGQSGSSGKSSGDVWTWTPQVDNIENTYVKSSLQQDDKVTATDGMTLEEMAPFPPDFYRAMGELVKEAFHPGSVKDLNVQESINSARTPNSNTNLNVGEGNNRNAATKTAIASLERYSLPRMHDAFRITRIMLSMEELNVGSSENDKFISLLLHYCEGMRISVATEDNNDNDTTKQNGESCDNQAIKHTGKRIPILSVLFHHWSRLPRLENAIQQLSRRYDALLPKTAEEFWALYPEISIESSSTTGGASSFLGTRLLKIDSFKRRLDEELLYHVNGQKNVSDNRSKMSQVSPADGGLISLLAILYQSSDATLRGKCRRWIGQWLRSFALGSGSSISHSTISGGSTTERDEGLGASFISFCPLLASSSFGLTMSSSSSSIAPAGSGPISLTQAVAVGSGGGYPQNHLGMHNTSGCGLDALLRVLLRIISGFIYIDSRGGPERSGTRSRVLRGSHENLLFDCLIPLHRPSGMILWRDQTPLIGLYHETLVKCIGALVSADRTLIGPVVGALLHPDIWPTEGSKGSRSSGRGSGANTPKLVLLLHEVDTLISLLPKKDAANEQADDTIYSSFDPYLLPLVSRLCLCISSDNSRTSERSLQMFRNEAFSRIVKRRLNEVGPQFIRALCRCSSSGEAFEASWNPTVRKMTFLVLSQLEGYYNERDASDNEHIDFSSACREAVSGNMPTSNESKIDPIVTSKETPTTASRIRSSDKLTSSLSSDMTTLRGAMGNWRPPPKSRMNQVGAKAQPPTTVTGVAPWAVGSQKDANTRKKKQPPLTVTGVAPWAISGKSGSNKSLPARPISTSLPRPPTKKHISSTIESRKLPGNNRSGQVCQPRLQEMEKSLDPISRVRSYMAQLKPKGDGAISTDGVSSWAKAQMEESPLILPSLKFHDLVFGQELGTGAFSTVKYARQIVKDKTRSHWPEFAVKIVSTQKIEALGYEQSINREIAILRTFSHPNIARLISSFRFRDGAYLVLEYASGGDLHTLLRKNGSLDNDSTQFVIGSVAAALWSIHERGFVFVDCKPENILITESGHIKLTDFGGCRPVTQEASLLVKESGANLLQELRDGDWKQDAAKRNELRLDNDIKVNDDEEDNRIEGTTAYLPPELVIGGLPTYATDIWALGCVLFQCLSGRPPILEDTDEQTAQRIVSFHLNPVDSSKDIFLGCDETAFNEHAKDLVRIMLHRDASQRPNAFEVSQSEFFDGIDIFNLHKSPAHPLDVGTVAPASDAKWARRQFSSIWAPQPQAYNIEAASTVTTKTSNSKDDSPIMEGGERDESFGAPQKAKLTKIRE